MSIQLYIKAGTTTLDLQASGYKVIDGFHPDDPVCSVFITGSSIADVEAKISAIDAVFDYARRHKNDMGSANLYWKADNSGDAWTTKLLGGTVALDSGLTRRLRDSKARVILTFEREEGWDGDSIEIPLSNDNGTDVTGGIAIDNYDNNYVDINGDDIEGDLPAKTLLKITNTYATGRHWDVWIGQDWTRPGEYNHVLVPTANGSVSLTPGTEAVAAYWDLTSALMSDTGGREFKALVKFVDEPQPNVWYRFDVYWNAIKLWEGDQATLDTARANIIRDIDTIPMPPWLKGSDSLDGLTLKLIAYTVDSGVELQVDYLQLTPTDGFRYLTARGYGLPQNYILVDSGYSSRVWAETNLSKRVGNFIGYGDQIRLKPGTDQRLIFLVHSWEAGTAEEDRSSEIQIFYSPRRSTI